jgi:hypothetical protein
MQLEDYRRIFPVFWEHPAIRGITLWGFRPSLWRNAQGAYLVRGDGTERPALRWLQQYVRTTPACTGGPIGGIERFDPALDAIVAPGAQVEKLADGFTWRKDQRGSVQATDCSLPTYLRTSCIDGREAAECQSSSSHPATQAPSAAACANPVRTVSSRSTIARYCWRIQATARSHD